MNPLPNPENLHRCPLPSITTSLIGTRQRSSNRSVAVLCGGEVIFYSVRV